VIREY